MRHALHQRIQPWKILSKDGVAEPHSGTPLADVLYMAVTWPMPCEFLRYDGYGDIEKQISKPEKLLTEINACI